MFIYASIPIFIDIMLRTLNIAENTFASRFSTGFILGAATAFFVIPGIMSLKYKAYQEKNKQIKQIEENYGRKTG